MQDTTQRTDEWFAKRIGLVTGSRAAQILGISPFSTPDDVLREMVRDYHKAPKEEIGEYVKQYGRMHERAAMLCFMRKTGLFVEDVGFEKYADIYGASPDGLTDDGGVLELKCPQYARKGKPLKPLSEQPYYVPQLQLEMLATARGHAYFAQYRPPYGDPFSPDYVPEDMMIERIELDTGWLVANDAIMRAFHARYLSELDNPSHLAPLRISLDSDKALHIVNRIGELGDAIANFEQEKKDLLAKLVQMADEKDAVIHGHKLTKTKDSQSVAYSKAIKELLPDADLSKWTTIKPGYFRLS